MFKVLGWIPDTFPEDFKKAINVNPEFRFKISDYLPFEKSTIEEATKLLGVKNKEKELVISEDWIVYYLRKKALHKKISLLELTRIIYMMNQRRGFKSSRKDLKDGDKKETEKKWVEVLEIESVVEKKDTNSGKTKGYKKTFLIKAKNTDYEWEVKRFEKPEWRGKKFTFLIIEKVSAKGEIKCSFSTPKEDDWELVKVAQNQDIRTCIDQKLCGGVGEYFFNQLVKDKNYRIKQRIIDRDLYRSELQAIWNKQAEFHPELKENSKLIQIAEALYPTQTREKKEKLKEILSHDLFYVIANDIIYYQRDLKSQKKFITGCRFEKHSYKKDGIEYKVAIKAAPKSNPEFQEFRIWQDIHNIRVYEKEKIVNGRSQIDVDVTKELMTDHAKALIFDLFDSSIEVTQNDIFKILNDGATEKILTEKTHYINLFAIRTTLKGNETKSKIRQVFKKHHYETQGELLLNDRTLSLGKSETKFYRLWHILYSINSADKVKSEKGIKNALINPKHKFSLSDDVVEHLAKLSEFPKQYASYSSRAINKLLPLMRCDKYWNWELIPKEIQDQIDKIVTDGWDLAIDKRTGELIEKREFKRHEQFQGLPTWMACYVVYGRHSERETNEKYTSNKQIDIMKLIPNNSLRNPIVEQVVREALHLVKDIVEKYGQPDEIHIELARDLKKNAEERKRITNANNDNLLEKQRIKKILYELKNGDFKEYDNEGHPIKTKFKKEPNPESPIDIEKFRIWKESSGTSNEELESLFKDGKKERIPTNAEIKKYALWLSQKCASPYTGKIISLSKLFTNEYEIEHIIPQSRLKYDAFDNLVICEAAINPEPYKGNKLARIFIRHYSGQIIPINGTKYTILSEEEYIERCKNIFMGRKLRNLLREDIPDDFISRQINDTRYITRKLNELLYPITKDKDGLVFTIGSITSELKKEWGLNTIWKELLKSRFKRMENIIDKQLIVPDEKEKNKFHFDVPDNAEFNEKRIDHRHHALDALIIAATTKEHIRYLNSLNAVDTQEELKDIRLKLVKRKIREFIPPWPAFTKDAKDKLEEIIVSIKANNKLVSKPRNKYLRWENENGVWIKKYIAQHKPKEQGKHWTAIRKSLFKEPQGIIYLKEIKEVKVIDAVTIQLEYMEVENTDKVKTASYIYDKEARKLIKQIIHQHNEDMESVKRALKSTPLKDSKKHPIESVRIAKFVEYAAKRVAVDKSFTYDKIKKIPYWEKSPLAKLLKQHLDEYKGKPEEAFQGEGLELLTKKNSGKPIKKVTVFEAIGNKVNVKGKLVEADKGSLLFFVCYENIETGKRETETLPLLDSIDSLVNKLPLAPPRQGYKSFILSPNDLVYLPTLDEMENTNSIDWANKKKIAERIYKMVSCSGSQCYFIPHQIAAPIIETNELGANNKSERAWDGEVKYVPNSKGKLTRTDSGTKIVDVCIKIKVDRLGNIIRNEGV